MVVSFCQCDASIRLACGQDCGGIFLTKYWCQKAQFMKDRATPNQVFLGCIKNQAVQVLRSKPTISISSWPLLQFLPQGFCLRFCFILSTKSYDVEMQKTAHFLPQVAFCRCFISATESKLGHCTFSEGRKCSVSQPSAFSTPVPIIIFHRLLFRNTSFIFQQQNVKAFLSSFPSSLVH